MGELGGVAARLGIDAFASLRGNFSRLAPTKFASIRGQGLNCSIAVVTGEEELRGATCWALELLGCHRITGLSSTAMHSIPEGSDFVLCDLDLALQVLEVLADGCEKLVPQVVLICSKRMDRGKLTSCLDAGAIDYVTTPLRIQALRGMLLRLCGGPGSTRMQPVSPPEKSLARSMTESWGSYECMKVLGRGGFGEVFLVRRRRDGELFALKEIDVNHFTANEQRRVFDELRIHRALNCPLIVRYHTSWLHSNVACLLMEYVEAGSLSNEIKRHSVSNTDMPDSSIMSWTGQIAVALLYLHHKEVVHRDLKPDNILGPNPNGCVKLADFGVSKRLRGTLLMSGSGTAEALAPERCEAVLNQSLSVPACYGPPGDVWALGVVVYELTALQHPFRRVGICERSKLCSQVIHEKPPPLDDARAPALLRLVDLCLRKDPEERPSSADLCRDPDLGKAIYQFLHSQNLLEHPAILEVIDAECIEDGLAMIMESSDMDVVTLCNQSQAADVVSENRGPSTTTNTRILSLASVFVGYSSPESILCKDLISVSSDSDMPISPTTPASRQLSMWGSRKLEAVVEASNSNTDSFDAKEQCSSFDSAPASS